jgi:ABC-type branched-subunit amino acid transport system permease subunit
VFWYFWIGLFMIFVVLFARGGVLGLIGRAWPQRRKP